MKDIPGYEGLYACDEEGKIYSLEREYENMYRGRIRRGIISLKSLRLAKSSNGFLTVGFRKDGNRKSFLVHRLIFITFRELQKDQEVCHIDGNNMNNNLSNLAIYNRSEDFKNAFIVGKRSHFGARNPRYYITEVMKEKVVAMSLEGLSSGKIAKHLSISKPMVLDIINFKKVSQCKKK